MTHHPNTPASRTEQAAPSVASGAVVDVRRLAAEARANPGIEVALSEGTANAFRDALAAPGAAIAARGQEVDEATALKGGRWVSAADIEHMTGELLSLATGDPYTPTKMVDAFHTLRAALASRQEAPAASAQPMFFASPEQANALQDRPDDAEGGVYLPLRKTVAGKFTMPLYAAPTAARSPGTVAQPVTDEQIIEVWNAWPRQGVTSRKTAVEFARAVLAIAPAAQPCPSQGCGGDGGEAVHVEAVATVVKRRHGLEWELELDWLAEGGINSLAEGAVLLLADSAMTDDEGSGTVYRAALSTDKGDGGSKE